MKMKVRGWLGFGPALVAGVVLVFASLSPARAGQDPIDPCGLITRAEAAALLAEEVDEPRTKLVQAMAAGRSCTYFTSAPIEKRGGKGSLKLIAYDPQTMAEHGIAFKSPVKYFHKNLSVMKKHGKGVEEISGLGDGAAWTPSSGVLHVLAGDLYFTLEIRDLVKMSAKTRTELDQKLAQHRKELSLKAAKDYILPRLKAN